MNKLETLIKKRGQIDQEIEQLKQRQKRGERVAQLAGEAGLLDLGDDELRMAFRQIAETNRPS